MKNCRLDYHTRKNARFRAKNYVTRSDIVIEKKSEKNCHEEHKYRKLKLLGKGGFAKVYRVEDMDSGEKFALKIVEKKGLEKKNREKLSTEIKIHSSLDHRYICKFIRFFEDRNYVYLLLELCDCDTLMEIMASRKRLSEVETKYFMYQLILAMVHMHKKRIIHRDMKLGNIFLDEQLDIKIGDFGLAAQLSFDGQRKRTLCGTPNYIAPEILLNARNGHSYEVDIWSLGVILFTLLTGKPPFETRTVKETYRHIKRIQYAFPEHVTVSNEAKELIQDIFQRDPFKRPTIFEILEYPFFKDYRPFPTQEILQVPRTLYSYAYKRTRKHPDKIKRRLGSYMTDGNDEQKEDKNKSKKKSEKDENMLQVPLGVDDYLKKQGCGAKPVPVSPHKKMRHHPLRRKQENIARRQAEQENGDNTDKENPGRRNKNKNKNGYDSWLFRKLETSFHTSASKKKKKKKKKKAKMKNFKCQYNEQKDNNYNNDDLLAMKKNVKKMSPDDDDVPTTTTTTVTTKPLNIEEPTIWVEDIADYSKKYGLAYRYNTGIIGSFFNDYTMMLYNPSRGTIKYFVRIDEDDTNEEEEDEVVEQGKKKKKKSRKTFQKESYTITNFPERMKKKMTLIKYFHNHFEKTKGSMIVLDDETGGLENEDVFVKMFLKTRDATVFRLSNRIVQVRFTDNSEIILSSEAKMVTYVSKYKTRKTYALEDILEENPDPSISKRLKYTKNILFKLIKK